MAYRKPVSISFPPPLLKEVERRAKKQHQTTSELVRAAIRQYLTDTAARDAAWQSTLAYGEKRAKALGIKSEEDVYRIVEEVRHGKPSPHHAPARHR